VTQVGFCRWTTSVVQGSSYVAAEGSLSTVSAPGLHRPGFFSGATTVILGGDEDDPVFHAPTTATWLVPIRREALGSARAAYLLIGCVRFFGGLHSRLYNAAASIKVNGSSIDLINLRIRPDQNYDYFHRPPGLPHVPNLAPFDKCATVYSWSIPLQHLDITKVQQFITITIDPHVAWDIDYIGIVCNSPHRLFISYSHADARVAYVLKQRLVRHGISTWIDSEEIGIGDSLINAIQKGMDSVQYICALLSRHSVNSNWVQRELEVALTKEITSGVVTVLPIVLDDCKIPSFILTKRYADLRPPRNYARVVSQIKSAVCRGQ
jgi:hypothetical protein